MVFWPWNPIEDPGVDFRMRYYNADGGEAEMCGNGARCFARFVHPFRRAESERVRFLTPAGLITGEYVDEDEVRINLTAPTETKINQRADFGWGEIEYHFMNTGVPHAVVYAPDAEKVNIVAQGRAIRRSPIFPRGTNVNFVQVAGAANLIVRTYERGRKMRRWPAELAWLPRRSLRTGSSIWPLPPSLKVRGGDVLTVNAQGDGDTFREVTLTGPAKEVFSGEIKL